MFADGPHAWLTVSGQRIDSNPNLGSVSLAGWVPIPNFMVVEDWILPEGAGEFVIAHSSQEQHNRMVAAQYLPGTTAIYREFARMPFGPVSVQRSFEVIKSPLSGKLKNRFPEDVYVKAALHLLEVLDTGVPLLADCAGYTEAWARIAKLPAPTRTC
jgi:hypothetical protein